jgi:N-acetyl-anhydromuramyl-L-alanine amidase AmpD
MRRLFPLALLIGGCQQAMTVPEPTLQRPQIVSQSAPPAPTQVTTQRPTQTQSHPYQYLAPQAPTNPWIPYAAARPWKWIVIHHSDTKNGSAAAFDRYHKDVHHWDELGYHFVIGNGNGSADGQVEVGPRWSKQKWGAHAGVKEYNEFGIGICLVGDFDVTKPTPAQMRSLTQLTAWLMANYHIPASHVIGHKDAKSTNCPGKYMDLPWLRTMASRTAAAQVGVARAE